MSDRTDSIDPADNERQWKVEETIMVEVGGEFVDPHEGRTVTGVIVRMPAFVAEHLAAGLAVLAEVAEMMTRSSFDETEMVTALRRAARTAEMIDRRGTK